MGYQVLETDTSMFILGDIILAIYVDDILIAGPFIQDCNATDIDLSRKLEAVNKGEIKSFLGLNFVRNYEKHARAISQPDYIDRLLAKFNMTNARSVSTLFEIGTKLKLAIANDVLCNVSRTYQFTQSSNNLPSSRYCFCSLQTFEIQLPTP